MKFCFDAFKETLHHVNNLHHITNISNYTIYYKERTPSQVKEIHPQKTPKILKYKKKYTQEIKIRQLRVFGRCVFSVFYRAKLTVSLCFQSFVLSEYK